MVLTVSQSIELAKHALGGNLASTLSGFGLVEQAGRVMENAHEWLYIQRTTRSLTYRPETTLVSATYDTSTHTVTLAGAFVAYAFVPGDSISVTIGGTGFGNYPVTSKVDDNTITIDSTLTGGPYTVDGKLETSRIALPSDFGRLIRLEGKDSFITRTYASSPSEIMLMQTSAIPGTGFNIAFAIEYAQATAASAPVPTLRLWPTPTETDFEALSATYSREWPSFAADTDEIPIPSFLEPLFLQYVRIAATGLDSDPSIAGAMQLPQAYDALRSSRLFVDATMRDSAAQGNRGISLNGAIRRHTRVNGLDPLEGTDTARLFNH